MGSGLWVTECEGVNPCLSLSLSTAKIKINLDRSQEPIKLLVINANKELYVAPARNSEAILARIEPPADADEETKKKVVFPSAVTEFGKELSEYFIVGRHE